MATVTPGYTWVSGETVTVGKMNSAAAPTVSNIVNADIDANAAIAGSKLNLAGTVTNAAFAGSVGLNAWTTKTANYTAVTGDRINANTTGGSFTVTLPSSPATYAEVTLADHAGTWETNNLTVGRNSQNINGGAADLTCDVSGKQILLRYEGATIGWRIYT